MLFIEFITWWYGRGYVELFRRAAKYINLVWQKFSVAGLAKTLFEPWHRITSEYGKSLQDKFRALIDNMVSRFIGFMIRLIVIISAFISIIILSIMSLIMFVLWPLAPIVIIMFIVGVVL